MLSSLASFHEAWHEWLWRPYIFKRLRFRTQCSARFRLRFGVVHSGGEAERSLVALEGVSEIIRPLGRVQSRPVLVSYRQIIPNGYC